MRSVNQIISRNSNSPWAPCNNKPGILARNNMDVFVAIDKRKYDKTPQEWANTRTARLPKISPRRPQIGPPRSWSAPNAVWRYPYVIISTPMDLVKY